MDLNAYIRDVPDFPKPGILFKDITPLLLDHKATRIAVVQMARQIPSQIDKVIAMESRGFFFGLLLAQEIGCGFVPVRKPDKLPGETLSKSYQLEYGTDTLEMHKDAISAGENVIIHDDVLATGGTAAAVMDMLESAQVNIIQFNFLMELSALKGRQQLKDYSVCSLLQY